MCKMSQQFMLRWILVLLDPHFKIGVGTKLLRTNFTQSWHPMFDKGHDENQQDVMKHTLLLMETQRWMRANIAKFMRTLWWKNCFYFSLQITLGDNRIKFTTWTSRGVSKCLPNQKMIRSVFANNNARQTWREKPWEHFWSVFSIQ